MQQAEGYRSEVFPHSCLRKCYYCLNVFFLIKTTTLSYLAAEWHTLETDARQFSCNSRGQTQSWHTSTVSSKVMIALQRNWLKLSLALFT